MIRHADSPNSIEITIVECQEVFILVLEALDCMRLTFGEVPDVAISEFFNLVLSILIDCRD